MTATCPDIDVLVEVARGNTVDASVSAHVRECPTCQADVELLGDVAAALEAHARMPTAWVDAIMAALPSAVSEEPPSSAWKVLLPSLGTGALAAATVLVAGLVTQVPPGGPLLHVALAAAVVAGAADRRIPYYDGPAPRGLPSPGG